MKILCIGRNYADHIAELQNETPDAPVIFAKPDTALLQRNQPFSTPISRRTFTTKSSLCCASA